MIFKNPKTQKIISFLLIIFILLPTVLFSKPQKAEAATVITVISDVLKTIGNLLTGSVAETSAVTAGVQVKTWYEKVLQLVLQAAARKVLQEVTKSTVSWINSGFHGSPLFLENPQSFFNDIAKSQVKMYVDMFGYDRLKFPFGKDFALNTIATYKNTLENNAAYTLSNTIKDTTVLNNYRNDFNFGGWNAFLINTQYPQNNYLGFQMTAVEELAREVQGTAQSAAQKVNSLLQQGQGFLSPQTCPSNPGYNNGVNEFQKPQFNMAEYTKKNPYPIMDANYGENTAKWQADLDQAKADWAKDNTCPKGLVNTTPGKIAGDQIANALKLGTDQATLAGAMGNSLSTIFDALLNKFIGDGLNSLASNTNSKSAPVDNWSYDGQTLGSPNDSDWASGPDQVIILKDFRILIDGKTVVTFTKGQQLFNENGELMVYGADTPILCKDGDRIVDADGNTIEECTRGEPISCKVGEKIISKDNRVYNCVKTEDGIQRHSSDPARLDPVLAEGGEVVTLIGDKSIKRDPNTNQPMLDPVTGEPIPIPGREYFPGNMENTVQELAILDNPCEPSDTACSERLKIKTDMIPCKPTDTACIATYENEHKNEHDAITNPIDQRYIGKYQPGLAQLFDPVVDATKTLDRCIPGPDKGWEFRLNEENARIERKFIAIVSDEDKNSTDDFKKKQQTEVLKELKFAVNSFRGWIDLQFIKSLPGALVYIDAVKEIDTFSQKTKELIDSKRTKFQALARLNSIKTLLDQIAKEIWEEPDENGNPKHSTQPETGSSAEKRMISLKKQYDAVASTVSSVTSLEDSKNQLNILKKQYSKLTNDTNPKDRGLIALCMEQRRAKGWTDPDPSGLGGDAPEDGNKGENPTYAGTYTIRNYNSGSPENDFISVPTRGTEMDRFCKIAIISGYSHGLVTRNDEAARENNCFPTPGNCESWSVEEGKTQGWFRFRNPLVDHRITTTIPLVPQEADKGQPGYQDLPLVNAHDVYGDTNKDRQSIEIDCRSIFKARNTDYTEAGDINSY